MGKAYIITKRQFLWILILQVVLLMTASWLGATCLREHRMNQKLVLRLTSEYVQLHREIIETCPPSPGVYFTAPIQTGSHGTPLDDNDARQL